MVEREPVGRTGDEPVAIRIARPQWISWSAGCDVMLVRMGTAGPYTGPPFWP